MDADADSAWKGLLKSILKLPRIASVNVHLVVQNGHKSEVLDVKDGNHLTVQRLEQVLGDALREIQNNVSVADKDAGEARVIVPWHSGTLLDSGSEMQLDGARGEDKEALRNAVISTAAKRSGMWAYEVMLTGTDPSVEIGWMFTHTIDEHLKLDFARLNTKSGIFSFRGVKFSYLPSGLRLRQGDFITCFLDIDTLTFRYALNGIFLPDLSFEDMATETD